MTVAASIKRLIAPLLAVALLGSCDYLQSFETACARRLPATSVKVVTEPARYKVDGSESYSQLARRGAEIASYGRTIVGLTTANLSSSVEVTVDDLEGQLVALEGGHDVRASHTPAHGGQHFSGDRDPFGAT